MLQKLGGQEYLNVQLRARFAWPHSKRPWAAERVVGHLQEPCRATESVDGNCIGQISPGSSLVYVVCMLVSPPGGPMWP